ncbi:monocarboxylate transporter 12-like [Amphiura filiformis]|uniref:monocarboxylate transporter 12-like n=1 Tax=Amphiura filiformis TaxID=82378 RepID=UPI003B210E59
MGTTVTVGLMSTYFATDFYRVAANIITTGFPLGILAFSASTQLLIDIYGWRGAMLLLAGINFHSVAAASLLKPLTHSTADNSVYQRVENLENNEDNNQNVTCTCINDTCNASLFKNRPFIIIIIVSFACGYCHNGWVVYLVSITQSQDLSPNEAVIMATISGVGAFMIRIILAIFQGGTSPRLLLCGGSFITAGAYAGLYYASSFLTTAVVSCLLGIGLGVVGSQVYVAANATIEKDQAINAMAWLHFVLGIGYIISGYVNGFLFDISGNFRLSLIGLSAASTFIPITIAAEDLWNIFTRR